LLELADGDADQLLRDGDGASKGLASLFDFFTSLDSDLRIWPQDWNRSYILFTKQDSWPTNLAQASKSVEQLWKQLNIPSMAPIPEILEDLLILPGRVLEKAPDGLRVLWLAPPSIDAKSDELILPETLLDLISFIEYSKVIQDLTRRLNDLPVGPAEINKWITAGRSQLLDRYMSEHFRDRNRISTELLHCTQDFRSLKREMGLI
jgi:hypothetical protein